MEGIIGTALLNGLAKMVGKSSVAEFLTPRENPRRRSVCPTGRSLGFSSGGLKGIGQNLDNGSKNSENQ